MRKQRNAKNNGSKTNYKRETKSAPDQDVANKKGNNDASWYAQSNQLIRDTASLSFNNPLGNILDLGVDEYYGGYSSSFNGGGSIPGVMAFDVHLTPGWATGPSSPINIASRNIYSYVRHQNSGSWNYDSCNLMMYILAMDSIYAMYNDLKRLYGVMTTYSVYSKYMPSAIVAAMGYDYNDFQEHLVDLRAYLNQVCNKINTRCVPATMSYLIRHSWMFSNIYMDSDDPKAQLYVFRMDNHYVYHELSEPSQLINNNHDALINFKTAVAYLDTALSKVIESQDFAIMSGDILKAYGESSLFRVSPVEDNYSVRPVYNPEVLNQIHNATILSEMDLTADDIKEDVNTLSLVWTPTMKVSSYGYRMHKVLDMFNGDTSPEQVMVATRLTVICSKEEFNETAGSIVLTPSSLGSEFICGCRIWYYSNTDTQTPLLASTELFGNYSIGSTEWLEVMGKIALLSKFKAHPAVNLWSKGVITDPSTYYYLGDVFDVDHYTVITHDVLDRMNETALLSEFGVIS